MEIRFPGDPGLDFPFSEIIVYKSDIDPRFILHFAADCTTQVGFSLPQISSFRLNVDCQQMLAEVTKQLKFIDKKDN